MWFGTLGIFFVALACAAAPGLPGDMVPACSDPSIHNVTLYYDMLAASTQMPAQEFGLRVGVPFDVLVALFNQPPLWPTWNHLFGSVYFTDPSLPLCSPFDNVTYTNAPKVVFPPGMTAPHFIDQHGFNVAGDQFAFGWVFKLLAADGSLIAYGRHTFHIARYVDESGVEASVMSSYEKVAGPQLDTPANAYAWTVAIEESLVDGFLGAVCLERVYQATNALNPADVKSTCTPFAPARNA
jgi:hypothetical protein